VDKSVAKDTDGRRGGEHLIAVHSVDEIWNRVVKKKTLAVAKTLVQKLHQ